MESVGTGPALLAGVRAGPESQRIMNLATGDVFTVSPVAGNALSYATSPDHQRFALFDADAQRLTTHDAHTGAVSADIGAARAAEGHQSTIGWFGFSSDGSSVFVGDSQPRLTEWWADTGALLRSMPLDDEARWALAVGPADQTFVAVGSDGRMAVWSIDSGSLVADLGKVIVELGMVNCGIGGGRGKS